MKQPIISKTGRIHGRGSDTHKWVSKLTQEERDAVRAGDVVLIADDNGHYTTTEFKQVHWCGGYYHRNYYPPEEVT